MKYPRFYFFILFIFGQWEFIRQAKKRIDRINKANSTYEENVLKDIKYTIEKSMPKYIKEKRKKLIETGFLRNHYQSYESREIRLNRGNKKYGS